VGAPEIVTLLSWAPDEVKDGLAKEVLWHVVDYLSTSGQRILAGESMPCAWSTIRFEAEHLPGAPAEALAVHEMADRLGSPQAGFVPGIAMTVDVLLQQDAALRRNGLADDAPRPHCDQMAVVCDQMLGRPLGTGGLMLERMEKNNPDDSGWMIGRTDCAHDHDDSRSFHLTHIKHVVSQFPVLLAYIAAPLGTTFLVHADKVIVFAPGAQRGQADPVPPGG
jgi:hypothetical protein